MNDKWFTLPVARLLPDSKTPRRATKYAAGFDLHAAIGCTLEPFQRGLIPTGVGMAIPEGMVGLVCPRSGLAHKHGITVLNAPGIIDPDYRGDVGVLLINFGAEPFEIKQGDRIAQLVVVPHAGLSIVHLAYLDDTARGAGGFGSTGV